MRTWPALDVSRPQPAAAIPTDGDADDLVRAALTDFDLAAIDETDGSRWRVFFQSEGERDRALAALGDSFPTLALRPVDVVDDDWAARSQASLGAVRVGKITVAPPWDLPLVITIQPSMGFGTGHHATTRLCLAALQRLDLTGRTVIDVGTGSGVLAIAASLLGAGEVLGIDDDADAVQAARENLELNPDARVSLQVMDLGALQAGSLDVVLANLTGGLLQAAAGALRRLTVPGGRLILSGFMESEEADVLAAYADRAVEDRAREDEWLCITLR